MKTCDELRLRKIAGDIKDFEREKRLDLTVNGHHITNYYIDFVIHHNSGELEFVESKGMETKDWLIKWRLFEALHKEMFPGSSLRVVKR